MADDDFLSQFYFDGVLLLSLEFCVCLNPLVFRNVLAIASRLTPRIDKFPFSPLLSRRLLCAG